MGAIKLKIKQTSEAYDPSVSKFLGSPTLPEGMLETLEGDVIFLLQINLEEIKDLDRENRLPHTGYLYFFLNVADGIYDLKPIVKYAPGEPTVLVDNFNEIVEGFEPFVEEYPIEFELVDEEGDGFGTKLFGVPADWNYAEEPPKLLLQFDPLEPGLGIFDSIDGLLYFFFDEKEPENLEKVNLVEEYS